MKHIFRMSWIATACICLLLQSGCGPIYRSGFVQPPRQPISGPVEIGPEWLELTAPEPLIPYGKNQVIVIGFNDYDKNGASWNEELELLNLSDGRQTRVEAFIYDDRSEEYSLTISGFGGFNGGLWLSRKSEVNWDNVHNASNPEYSDVGFPQDRRYIKLRIRSEIPLKCDFIAWTGTNPK